MMDIAPLVSQEKIALLLVEDSRSEAAVLCATLEKAVGARLAIETAATFTDALKALATKRFDAILLDLGLPDVEGLESVTTLGKSFPHIPVVILSGHEDELAVMRSLKYGAEAFLSKQGSDGEAIWHAIASAIFRKSLHKPDAKN